MSCKMVWSLIDLVALRALVIRGAAFAGMAWGLGAILHVDHPRVRRGGKRETWNPGKKKQLRNQRLGSEQNCGPL